MKNIELYVYDRDLNFEGVIDEYSSLRWRRKYFEAGEFELHLEASKENINLFKKDSIITRAQSTEAGFVKSVQITESDEKTELIIIGRFLSYLLYRRIVKSRINFTGKILAGMRRVLNEMTPFSNLIIGETSLDSDNIAFQVTYKNVYNHIVKLSKACNIGFRIIVDLENKKYKFENYEGLDRTVNQAINSYYVFSEEYSNINKADYINDAGSLCTYALIGGEGEGDNRILAEINNTTGLHDFDIVEAFVDAKSESKGDLSLNDYKAILREKGNEKISTISESIEYEVYANDYKKNWDLGDVVTVKKESWNIQENLRITEVEEVIEGNVTTITPVFGTPLKEKFVDGTD